MDNFMIKFLILFNIFINKLEQNNDTGLIFHAQMLFDRLEDHIKKNYK